MALSPILNVPVTRQDTTIEVVRQGDGTHDHDEVFVTTSITIAGDIDPDKEVIAILPMATAAQYQPLLRWTADDITTNATPLDPVKRSTWDQAVGDALQGLEQTEAEKQQALADAIGNAAQGFSQAVLKIQPGQRDLRFFYTLAAPTQGNRQYGFEILGPLATFTLQPGGSIGVIAILPHGATLIDATAVQNPNDPGSVLPRVDANLGGRQVVGWNWQYDPKFTVSYQY
ncbi:unannotated protein [freshwater metagenome]|uniref:Unannotated protein n=1 Tax=freshwater metagenome TaxID=449393 RepID=A0A6J7L2R6_9ZZZZ|nr:hypothetical protein [Actinomycetota bacterium]